MEKELYSAGEEFLRLCHLIQSKNMVSGSGGNISFRVGDKILITPSGRSLESLTMDDVVVMNMDGSYTGELRPSSEYRMHIACYVDRPDVNAVVHVHSVYAVAVSCMKELNMEKSMPVYTPGYGKRVAALPAIPYMLPGSAELAEAVRNVIKTRNSVLLQNHGIVTVGKNSEQALNLAEEIEENAHLSLLLNMGGRELSPEQQANLVNYGSAAGGKK